VPSRKGYPVGYGKPPKHTQFRKGQSGNPSGRRGWSSSFAVQLDKALKKLVTVKINGRARRITRQELIAEQAVNRAASADWRYVKLLFGHGLLTGDDLELWPRDKDGRPQLPLEILRELMGSEDDDGENGND
jgi:Family of unknown function (DUF5681)